MLEENARNKENARTKAVANKDNDKKVVVPVAQFEAFKVYEDEETQQQPQPPRQPKPVENDPYNIYKEQIGNRFITKKELAEIEGKPKPKQPSPMSIEKCENVAPMLEADILIPSRSSKDIFFEVEEYRASIYQYLREHEVSIFVFFLQVFFFSTTGRRMWAFSLNVFICYFTVAFCDYKIYILA